MLRNEGSDPPTLEIGMKDGDEGDDNEEDGPPPPGVKRGLANMTPPPVLYCVIIMGTTEGPAEPLGCCGGPPPQY